MMLQNRFLFGSLLVLFGMAQVVHSNPSTFVSSSSSSAADIPIHTDINNNKNKTAACHRFRDLRKECHCQEPGHHQVKINCLKSFHSIFFNDTIGLLIDFDICNTDGSKMDIDLIESNYNIQYTVAGIHAGEKHNFPIPGLSIVVPSLGHVGIDLAVLIEGNPDMLKVQVGLDACVALQDKQVCASSIPGLDLILPWYVLRGNYTFGEYCETKTATTTTTSKTTTTTTIETESTNLLEAAVE